MTVREFKVLFYTKLTVLYPKNEVDIFFALITEEYLAISPVDVIVNPTNIISQDTLHRLEKVTQRLLREEPIQYILGKTEFYGLPFYVNKNTLIPRPETEELVDWIIEENKQQDSISILDIGTGSGCIPIALKKNLTTSNICAIDVSEKALEIAKKNMASNNVNIEWLAIDILRTEQLPKKFDIIVSNPPYVRQLEKNEMKKNVLENEPHLALFVTDNNPLIFYSKIADLAKRSLTKNGMLFFEINQYLAEEMLAMMKNKGYTNIELRKDFRGNDRMIKASYLSDEL
ncbi:peptide chain release factor N(5)-glutamine methyltransferase [Tenacibaculum sp. SG-28]|uniref:peptide chain release factor N(5)-glutamine methyltransferase n=1 Tax=Tenacibaculum sp. SG-28 TaxID=754426 RepID=UPI000CF48E05|nr:peptide chain release factor N(5)-glutamine methyltransferase [Tenacibaculum sp. SG-28]PQJ23399.1 protein-(glutamine-N5) methyltransferase, release factor-specific [Tenacibaculum sp. SG-28]